MNEQELEILYTRQLGEELILQTRQKMNTFIEVYPHEFDLENLFPTVNDTGLMREKLAELYQEICKDYNDNGVEFNHAWVRRKMLIIIIFKLQKITIIINRIGPLFGDNNLLIKV